MSVIEFFVNYWDWYLLIGFLFGIYLVSGDPTTSSYRDRGIALVLITLFWPLLIRLAFE
jgi:hypothetical protein